MSLEHHVVATFHTTVSFTNCFWKYFRQAASFMPAADGSFKKRKGVWISWFRTSSVSPSSSTDDNSAHTKSSTFLDALGAVFTLGRGRKCNGHWQDSASGTQVYVQTLLRYRNASHLSPATSLLAASLWVLKRQVLYLLWWWSLHQGSFNPWPVWIARYGHYEDRMSYLVWSQYDIMHLLMHVSLYTNMCLWKDRQSISKHYAHLVLHSTRISKTLAKYTVVKRLSFPWWYLR